MQSLPEPTDPDLRLVVIDDDPELRSLIRLHCGLLAFETTRPGLVVAGDAADGQTGYELTALVRPDIVLVDHRMPDISGILLLRLLLRAVPSVTLVMLTVEAHLREEALQAGAHAFATKIEPLDEVLMMARTICLQRRREQACSPR